MANATDKQGGPFIYAEGQNDAGQPDDTVSVSAHFVSRAESVIEDLIHNAELQHRATCWHKGMNADLLDSKHAAYLTTAVNEDDVDHPDLNDSSPAAPSGGLNVKWQVATAQNTDSQTPVSAYVPFSSISTVTAVSTDYVVITDTSDSNNPKRALVSDIITAAAAAPLDAQYVTLATNATLTNERVLTAGTGLDLADAGAGSTITIDLDLSELSAATAAAADHLIFVDADDSGTKKTTMADALVALGAAPSSTAVTAASVLADNEVPRIDGASRAVQPSNFYIDDAGVTQIKIHPADGNSAAILLGLKFTGADNAGNGGTGDMAFDAGNNAGGGNAGAVNLGTVRAESVAIGRSGKNTQVNGTLGVTGAATCSSTLASGAHTITQATDETEGEINSYAVGSDTLRESKAVYYDAAVGSVTLATITPVTNGDYEVEVLWIVEVTTAAGDGNPALGDRRHVRTVSSFKVAGGTVTELGADTTSYDKATAGSTITGVVLAVSVPMAGTTIILTAAQADTEVSRVTAHVTIRRLTT